MYRCLNCNAHFDKPEVYVRWGEQTNDDPPMWDGCPRCGNRIILKVHRCSVCNEVSGFGYRVKLSGDFICDDCLERIEDND